LDECTSLRLVIIQTGCGMRTKMRMRINEGLQKLRPFLIDEAEDMKRSRHHIDLDLG
jgi:hypothetical protein